MEADLQVQPCSFGHRIHKQVSPLVIEELHRSRGDSLADIHDEDAAEPNACDSLEVCGDALARDVAVQPKPKHPRPGRGRRRVKPGLQLGAGRSAHRPRVQQTQSNTQAGEESLAKMSKSRPSTRAQV